MQNNATGNAEIIRPEMQKNATRNTKQYDQKCENLRFPLEI